MITKLTKKQESKIEVYRRKWHDKYYKEDFNEEKARKLVNWMYSLIGLPPPTILILDSPLSVQLALNMIDNQRLDQQADQQLYLQLGQQLKQQLEQQLHQQLKQELKQELYQQLHQQLEQQLEQQLHQQLIQQLGQQLEQQLHQQLYQQLEQQLNRQLEQQLRQQLRQQLHQQLKQELGQQLKQELEQQDREYQNFNFWGDTSWYGYLAFYDYINHELLPKYHNEIFEKYLELVTAKIDCLITRKNIAFISKPPTTLTFNKRNRLHNAERAAIEYSDGYKIHYIHGVYFPEKEWTRIVNNELSSEEILSEENIEKRMAIMSVTESTQLLDAINAQLIHQSSRGNQLYSATIQNKTVHFLKYACPSTGRVYVSGVPKFSDADEAMCWKFQISREDYDLLKQET